MILFNDIQVGKLYFLDIFDDFAQVYMFSKQIILVLKTFVDDDGYQWIEYLDCEKQFSERYNFCELFNLI